jgi:2-aminomuconate deaminase
METKRLADKPKPVGNYPHAKRAGDFIFVSGMSARQADDSMRGASVGADGTLAIDIREQTAGTIENIRDVLAAFGAGLGDVCEIITYLTDLAHYAGYNEAYNRYFDPDGPSRTTVQVSRLPARNAVIEIRAIAYKPL